MNKTVAENTDPQFVHNVLVDKYDELEKGESLEGLPTGFRDLDKLLNGLQDEDLIVIGGKSIGKTTFALNICKNIATKADTCVSYFSLATKDTQISNRLLSSEGNINIKNLQRKTMTSEEWGRLTQAMGSLVQSTFYIIDDPVMNVKDIEEKVTELKEKHPDVGHLVVIDYLSLVDSEGQQNRYEQTDYIVKKLKIMARTLKCPVILLVNLSRSYDRRVENNGPETKPRLWDLRDSGTIEEDADVIMFLHALADPYYGPFWEKRITEVIVAKNRNGLCGTIQLAHVLEYMKFLNLDMRIKEDISE